MSAVRIRKLLVIAIGLYAIAVTTSVCSPTKRGSAPPPPTSLWGDLKPVVSVKELMRDMIDPSAIRSAWRRE